MKAQCYQWKFLDYPCRAVYPDTATPQGGKIGINKDPYANVGALQEMPTLLVHSFVTGQAPDAILNPSIIRLQTSRLGFQPINRFGEAKIEFWSNEYGNPNQWLVGKIQSFNAADTNAELQQGSYNFYGGLKFFSSGGPNYEGTFFPKEVMRLVNGKVGIGFTSEPAYDHLPISFPESFLHVKGDISTGGNNCGIYGSIGYDGQLSLYPAWDGTCKPIMQPGNIEYPLVAKFNLQNRSNKNPETPIEYGLNISYGSMPGYVFWENDQRHIEEIDKQGITDIVTFLGVKKFGTETYGKMVTIGCTPYKKNTQETYQFTTLNTRARKWSSAGPLGMLTVSDDKFPYWDGTATTAAWAEFPGNKVILRLERRNTEIATLPGIDDAQPYNFSFDNNYTLISAGHESLETFVVRSTGQVKIGRRAILYRSGSGIVNHNDFMLCVDGKIVASEIVILCNNDNSLEGLVKDSRWQTGNEVWPDFVFSSSYNLMPLNELENKINNNKHLPGIPPASEIAKNGINLGEFQSKLLQKIEELTLYIINLNKENETLKKRIHKLEKKRGRR